MATIELTQKNFQEVIASNDVVLIDFWAAWCAPCRAFAPTFEKVSQLYPDAVFAKVNADTQRALAGSFNIMAIPTLMIFQNNAVVFKEAGALREKALIKVIEKILPSNPSDTPEQTQPEQTKPGQSKPGRGLWRRSAPRHGA